MARETAGTGLTRTFFGFDVGDVTGGMARSSPRYRPRLS
jgi:hypothetical protein